LFLTYFPDVKIPGNTGDSPNNISRRRIYLNRQELVESVAVEAGVTKAVADRVSDAVFTVIAESLSHGEKVTIVGFGAFDVRDRAPRTGRNPQTGAAIQIAATRAPVFSAGKPLKESVR
jgi:DNA-binding protein HU-beta